MQVLIFYTVKPESAAENTRLIESMCDEFCDEFNDHHNDGLQRYAAFRGADGVTFYHFAFMLDGQAPLTKSPGFKAFKHNIEERYNDRPEHVLVSELGSYGFHLADFNPSSVEL